MDSQNQQINELQVPRKHPRVLWLESKKERIAEYCAHGITADQLCRTFATALLRDTNNDIANCTDESIILAVTYAGRLGVDPTGERNGAHFIAFRDTKKGITELKLMLGYGSLIELIIRNSEVMDVQTEIVYKGERFEVHAGTENRLIHEYDIGIRNVRSYDHVVAAYAVATYPNGHAKFQVLPRKQIDSVRNSSKQKDGVWKWNPEEMARKSTVRNLSKWLSIGPEFDAAIRISDEFDGIDERDNCKRREASEITGAPPPRDPDADAEFEVRDGDGSDIDHSTGEPVPPPSDDGNDFVASLNLD